MSLDIVAQLVQILKDAPEVGAIEIRRGLFGGWSTIRVTKADQDRRGGGGSVHVVAAPAPGAAPGSLPLAGASPGGAGAAGASAAAPAVPGPTLLEIKSPMVGTFYRSPEPGAEAYVKAGSRVAPGQVVCIIEAMKIMNEIESEVAGVVKEVLLENAQPVEFGQVLFRVDPNA
jgi:acetyl-CoA carboxylase biotin carboxyl carrier protein